MTVSSPGAYGQEGVVRVLGARAGSPDLTVTEATTYQPIDGFGGAFNEQGWDALAALDEGGRQQALRLLFDAQDGARFRFGRLPIGASDYALDRYTLDDVPGDYAMEHFSIERDRRLLIPYIARRPRRAAGPPAVGERVDAAAVAEDERRLRRGRDARRPGDALARTRCTWRASWSPTERRASPSRRSTSRTSRRSSPATRAASGRRSSIRDFVRDHLGPTFESRQVPAEIWLGTLNTADPRYASVVLGDAGARRHVRGIGVQWGALAITAELAASYPDSAAHADRDGVRQPPLGAGLRPRSPPQRPRLRRADVGPDPGLSAGGGPVLHGLEHGAGHRGQEPRLGAAVAAERAARGRPPGPPARRDARLLGVSPLQLLRRRGGGARRD